MNELVGWYTITLELPIKKLKILRARKYDNIDKKHGFKNVKDLSYIPKNAPVGRFNKAGESIFYGCIYFKDNGGVNVAFSEVGALRNEKINILKSKLNQEIKLNYIGIYDYVKRGQKPSFLGEKTYKYFEEVYNYQEKKYKKYLFIAFQLCDAFFSDILRRPSSDRLFEVTSILGSLFLEGDRSDGIVYTSVKAGDSPVIALKPTSVDTNISHIDAQSFEIQVDYGYAIYNAKPLSNGSIAKDGKITWP